MTVFSFRAFGADGAMRSGEIAAPTRQAALDALHRQGTMPVDLVEAPRLDGDTAQATRRRRVVSAEALAVLTRELATMTGAALPLEDALRIVALQPSLPAPVRRLVEDVLERVVAGAALSESLAAHPIDFPTSYVRLVAAGERSGALAPALTALAADLERAEQLRSELRSALLYPVTLLVAAVLTLVVVIAVLIPALLPLFEETGAQPPAVVALLDGIRRLLQAWWPFALPAVLGLGLLVMTALRTASARYARDRFVLRLPIIGRLIRRRETSRFSGALATLLRNGVPVLEAIRVAGAASSNRLYQRAARDIERDVSQGGVLSSALERCGLFAPLALRMTEVGERTGQLDVMLARLQRIEQDGLQRDLQRLVVFVAPALTIVIGLFVGGILLGVMSAVIGLNDLALR